MSDKDEDWIRDNWWLFIVFLYLGLTVALGAGLGIMKLTGLIK